MIHHHEFWWRFFPKKELTQLYMSLAIRTFAISLLGLFLPLYLHIEQGYSLQDTLLFFVFYSTIFAIMTPVGAMFAARFGSKHSVLMSIPLYLASVLLLYALPYYKVPLLVIGALLGASQAFFWLGTHLVFHHISHRKHRGEEMGKREGLQVFAAMLGPFLGGTLIFTVGFNLVFILASLLLIVSAAVLFKSEENHEPYHFSVRSVINKDHWKNSLAFVSRGSAVIANGVIWPLFIFFILGNYFTLGIAGSLLSGVTAILLLVVGKFSDHTNKRKIIRWATAFGSIVWVLRALVSNTFQVFGATTLAAIAKGTRDSPLGALEYDKAKGEVAAYFVSREVFICLGRILILLVVIATDSLSSGFIFHAIANFAIFLF